MVIISKLHSSSFSKTDNTLAIILISSLMMRVNLMDWEILVAVIRKTKSKTHIFKVQLKSISKKEKKRWSAKVDQAREVSFKR